MGVVLFRKYFIEDPDGLFGQQRSSPYAGMFANEEGSYDTGLRLKLDEIAPGRGVAVIGWAAGHAARTKGVFADAFTDQVARVDFE